MKNAEAASLREGLLGARENYGGLGSAPNTARGLTRSSEYTREGLGMQPTQDAAEGSTRLTYRVDESGCWIWTGYADPNGYGRVYDREAKQIKWAHRYSFEVARGPIAPRHEIDHECQVTLCVNPDHLAMVTKTEHARRTMQRLGKDDLHSAAAQLRRSGLTFTEIADALGYASRRGAQDAVNAAIAKGLIDAHEVPPVRRLTEDERDDIRVMYAMGIPQTVIGEFYRVDSSQVSRICNGKTGGHIGTARPEAAA